MKDVENGSDSLVIAWLEKGRSLVEYKYGQFKEANEDKTLEYVTSKEKVDQIVEDFERDIEAFTLAIELVKENN